ncbi:MAG: hypothetical protein ACMUJM_07945 [bacterium]
MIFHAASSILEFSWRLFNDAIIANLLSWRHSGFSRAPSGIIVCTS